MSNTHDSPPKSLDIIQPIKQHFDEPLTLACGEVLTEFDLVYETYGTLNADRSNGILICHALSGNHHAAGYHIDDNRPGWWDTYIGPGKVIDTNHFFIVCANNIGGCSGSTGPANINPETGQYWGSHFPSLRVRDWVSAQKRLMEFLHIEQWAAVIGGSLGGMQAMRWALQYPDALRHAIVIASAMRLSAQNLAFNMIARHAITTDPHFYQGHYLQHNQFPRHGLSIARMLGHLTYLSDDLMGDKFGRELRTGSFALGIKKAVEFQVESYLKHQAAAFSSHFDANTYLLMMQALDYFDFSRDFNNDAIAAFAHTRAEFFVVSFTSDWRFAPERSQEMVTALINAQRPVSYINIHARQGHDTFLLPIPDFMQVFSAYMLRVTDECR